MKCPTCKSELVIEGQEFVQNTSDHAMGIDGHLRDKYVCSDVNCPSHHADVFWDQFGELYVGGDYRTFKCIPWIDDNNAPFGSWQRRINVEIYKHDEERRLFKLFGWTFELRWTYTADEDGNVLTRKPYIQILTPDGVHYISGIHMLFYSIRMHFIHANSQAIDYYRNELRDDFRYPYYEFQKRDWWRWAVPFVLRVIDRKRYLELAGG